MFLIMDLFGKHWSIMLILVWATHINFSQGVGTMAQLVSGKLIQCSNEGERVLLEALDIKNCFPCTCKNGYVECDNKCPRIDECHMIQQDQCCKKCKGCNYKGKSYVSHSEWTDPEDPCKLLRCEAGVVTISKLHCEASCSHPIPPEKGKCCPTCPDCQVNGQPATEHGDIVYNDDPCLKCRCSKRGLLCVKKACPVLQCSPSNQFKPPDECCPRCNGSRYLFEPPKTCTIQKTVFRAGTSIELDRCTNCSCVNDTSICSRRVCPYLDCPVDQQRTLPGTCCPICDKMEVAEFVSQCRYDGKSFEDGQFWKLNSCSSCKCHDGKVSCSREKCNNTCASGMKQIQVPGECCLKCVENDGVCIAFGDPHFKSFDGKFYTFKGVGKYQFTSDCHNNSFFIKVASENIPRYSSSTTIRRVAVNFGDVRLNLQQRMRVKYNGKKINLPFKEDGRFSVYKERNHIEVKLQNDVVILWNGKSYLEVTVPPKYKNKLCGLCGNFNGDIQDDLTTKTGRNVSDKDLITFGASWCVGKKSGCVTKPRTIPSTCNKMRSELSTCKKLTSNIFSQCEPKLSNNRYLKACKMDMCNCPNRKCYCESFMAYARECERMGVVLNNWQKYTECDPKSLRRPYYPQPRPKIHRTNSQEALLARISSTGHLRSSHVPHKLSHIPIQ